MNGDTVDSPEVSQEILDLFSSHISSQRFDTNSVQHAESKALKLPLEWTKYGYGSHTARLHLAMLQT